MGTIIGIVVDIAILITFFGIAKNTYGILQEAKAQTEILKELQESHRL